MTSYIEVVYTLFTLAQVGQLRALQNNKLCRIVSHIAHGLKLDWVRGVRAFQVVTGVMVEDL